MSSLESIQKSSPVLFWEAKAKIEECWVTEGAQSSLGATQFLPTAWEGVEATVRPALLLHWTESHSQSECLNHHRNLFCVCAKFGAFKNNRSGPLKCTFYYLFLVPVLTGSRFFFMTVLLCRRPSLYLQRTKRWGRCWEQQAASADLGFPCLQMLITVWRKVPTVLLRGNKRKCL